ncbi:hypothetical protein [Halococcus agarilyticus]|uniref:hypothetical protein n=1 Tax=Halococcus agarilyticus TaxID=1232219 RepID=UPI000677DE32|nr:hypothetical protein [Halococcus agarilyticus]
MTDDVAPIRIAECDDGAEILYDTEESDGEVVARATVIGHSTCYQRGREQSRWVVDRTGREPSDYSLAVWEDGVVSAVRSVPYSGQRYYSTEDRRNRPDKNSRYRLDIEEVLAEYIERGEPGVSVDELRARVLSVLRSDDVATNANGEIDLLADEGRGHERSERQLDTFGE